MNTWKAGLVFGACAVFLLLIAVLGAAVNVPVVNASGTIYIRADGSIDPPTAPIQRDGDVYTFADDIYDNIELQRSNVIVDGSGYTLHGTEAASGFMSESQNNVTIKNTNIEGFSESGIYLVLGSQITICGNNITDNGQYGIEVWGVSRFRIFGNNVTGNGGSWGANLLLGGSFGNYGGSSLGNITENYISRSSIGIATWGPSNRIYRNSIAANEVGISIGNSGNAVFGNNLTNNGLGIELVDSTGSKIYHNNFINNTSQFSSWVGAIPNAWDDGYPSGGNYWSDFSGVDLYRGPFQNETGSDGISDTPRIIEEYHNDSYPLVDLWPSGPLSHELKATLEAPVVWPLNTATFLKATVSNSEINSEADVRLYLFIDSTLVNSTTIPLLEPSTSYTIGYLWTATIEGVHNITAYAAPLPEEIYLANNYENLFSITRHPAILEVPYDYPTIQRAVNAIPRPSMPEDTIRVTAGTYYENVVINTTLSLIGEGSSTTIVDANDTGNSVTISADNVYVTNFTLQQAGQYEQAGIRLESAGNCNITGNVIEDTYYGIALYSSMGNTISWNDIAPNLLGDGIHLDGSSDNRIFRNDIANNYDNSLGFFWSTNNDVFENNVTSTGLGIWVYGSSNNRFYHNNFYLTDVWSDGQNAWDNGYPSGGNYWSGYTGTDLCKGPYQNITGSDGIGDTPYMGDQYPLMNPWVAPFPVSRFTYSPKYPRLNDNIAFDASASYDSDGNVETYAWDFGDGNVASVITPTITHAYTVNGNYTVKLTVTDNEELNCSSTKSVKVRVKGEPLTVDDDGPADFHTIQQAINEAQEEDIIYVHNGTYNENLLLSKNGQTIIGESHDTTIINSVNYGKDVVTVNASKVSIVNFTILCLQYSGRLIDLVSSNDCNICGNVIIGGGEGGIYLSDSNNCTISGNSIEIDREQTAYVWGVGISLQDSSNSIISGNRVEGFYRGIFIDSSSLSTYISENRIANNREEGIKGAPIYVGPIHDLVITNNTITNNGLGIGLRGYGLGSSYVGNVVISYNNISFNNAGGIAISGYTYGTVVGSAYTNIFNLTFSYNDIISNNGKGISIVSESDAYAAGGFVSSSSIYSIAFTSNTIALNTADGVYLESNPHTYEGYGAYGYIRNVSFSFNKILLNNGSGIYMDSHGNSAGYLHDIIASANMICANEDGIHIRGQNHSSEEVFDVQIHSNTISGNHQKGMWIDGNANVNITRNSISYNTYGVLYSTVAGNLASYNDIYRNSFGMNVTNGAKVDATYNYWGDSTGPYHDLLNVYGAGDPVNGNGVDLDFIPFLADPVGQINERPTAALLANQTTTKINQTITFDASASTDDGQIEYYFFDFGDRTNSGWTDMPMVTHKYSYGGVYNASIIVVDNLGVSSLSSGLAYITIKVIMPPAANFTYKPEFPLLNTRVTFNASDSYDPDGIIQSYSWDFGDGNTTTVDAPIVTHIYTTPGTFNINLTVTDGDGLSCSTTKSVTITADSSPPTTVHDYDDLWHTTDFTITLTAIDDVTGVAETYYRINDGPTKTVSADGQPVIATESANSTLEYWSADNAGNEESHHVLTGIRLDRTHPSIEIPSRDPAGDVQPYQPVKVSVSATDIVSQVKNVTVYYSLDNGTTWEQPLLMTLNSSSGLYEVTIPGLSAGEWVKYRITAYDNAGNQAANDNAGQYYVFTVVPEFPSTMILPLLMILAAIVAALARRNRARSLIRGIHYHSQSSTRC